MAKTFEQLRQQAFVIKQETSEGANTANRIGQMFADTLDYIKDKSGGANITVDTKLDIESRNPVENRVIAAELKKIVSGGGGSMAKQIVLDVSPTVVYADRASTVQASARLINHVGVINLQADKAMQVMTSGHAVSSYNHNFTVNGADTIRATCNDADEPLEAVHMLQAVYPIFYGQAYNADELAPSQIAPPRATPAGTYTAHIDTDYSFCFLIPSSMGRLDPSKVKWNGFQFPLNYAGAYQYKQVNYDMYESGAFTEPTDVTLIIED